MTRAADKFHARFHASLGSAATAAASGDFEEAAAKLAVLSAETFAFSRIKRGATVHFIDGAPALLRFQPSVSRALRQAAKTNREIEVHTRDWILRGRAIPCVTAVLGARWEGAAK